MTTLVNVNMRKLCVEHKTLTCIAVKPTFAPLHRLLLQLKANVSSVPTTLGGGSHGYVGIIIPSPTYGTLVPMAPFITPVHPVPLMIALPATQYNIALTKMVHDEAIKAFQVC